MSTPERPPEDLERDAWLSLALRHAPDAQAAPPTATRDAILLKARAAAREVPASQQPSAGRSFAQRLFDAWRRISEPRVAGALASVMLATVVGMMWWGRPIDEALKQPEPSATDAAPAAASATPAAAAQAPVAAPAAPVPPAARTEGASEATPAAPAAPAATEPKLAAQAAIKRDGSATPREADSAAQQRAEAAQAAEATEATKAAKATHAREQRQRAAAFAEQTQRPDAEQLEVQRTQKREAPAAETPTSEAKRQANETADKTDAAAPLATPTPAPAPARDPAPAPAPAPTIARSPGVAAPAAAAAMAQAAESAQPAASASTMGALRKSALARDLANTDANANANANANAESSPAWRSMLQSLEQDPHSWRWQRDNAEGELTPALRVWLRRVDRAAAGHWREDESTARGPATATAATLRIVQDGATRALISLDRDGTLRIAMPGGATARVESSAAAPLWRALDAAVR